MKVNWIQIKHTIANKAVVTAFLFEDIRRVNADTKMLNSKMVRTFELVFADGSIFMIPDDAEIVAAPAEYTDLINEISKSIRV